MRTGDHTTLRQIELRDEAVRILHRAIAHVMEHQESAALSALQGPKAREWYEDIGEYSGLGVIFSGRAA